MKREQIITELRRRLELISTSIPNTPKFQTFRGWAGQDVNQTPSIYVFEDEERLVLDRLRRRCLYNKTLPVQVEMFHPTLNKDLYSLGNTLLERLHEAVECDEFFIPNAVAGDAADGLVIGFRMVRNAMYQMRQDTLLLIAAYEFDYVENFGQAASS